jgi:phthalate 4,5-cis-dihydrodiol dehydrogenase
MAVSLQEAEQMIEAADRNGVKLLAGHTRSFTMPVRAMRKIIQSGKLGRVRAIHLFAYTDWMLRPRSADELDINQGGGLPYRQAPHQLDTVRLLGGGQLRSLRGTTGQWMPERTIPGYYSAHMEFEDGTPASVMHDGYGYFIGAELVKWGHSNQRYTPEQRVDVRKQILNGTRNEEEDKQAIRIGGDWERKVFQRENEASWVPEDLGVVVVSCDRGVMRHSEHGIYVYDNDGVHDIVLEPNRHMGTAQRRAELEELYDSVVHGKPLWHDGRWGMATLEATLAIGESSRQRKEVILSHQIPVPAGYDDDFQVPGYL